MRDYVPKIIGPESFEHYIGPYGGYDPNTNPSASNVFATAAFRFGHGTISPILMRMNENFQETEHLPHLRLHDTFFSPWRIVKEGQYILKKLCVGVNNTSRKHTNRTIKMQNVEGFFLFCFFKRLLYRLSLVLNLHLCVTNNVMHTILQTQIRPLNRHVVV